MLISDARQFLSPLFRPFKAPSERYPLIIFSHGLVGTRNTYSQYCSALASEGNIVLAVEHRDGSGPAVLLPGEDGKDPEILHYVKHDELE